MSSIEMLKQQIEYLAVNGNSLAESRVNLITKLHDLEYEIERNNKLMEEYSIALIQLTIRQQLRGDNKNESKSKKTTR